MAQTAVTSPTSKRSPPEVPVPIPTAMFKIMAREIFNTPREQIWNIAEGMYEIFHEDGGSVVVPKNYVIFNRYLWDMFTLYPETPIIGKCDVANVIGNGHYNADTHIRALETIFGYICEQNNLHFYFEKEPLLRMVYRIVNNIYNEIVQMASEYVTTIDAVDFVETVEHPTIKSIRANLKPTPESVENAYKTTKTYINHPSTSSNRFARAYRSKAINENQANQCIGPRGLIAGLNREVYTIPVVNGFIRGMGNLYELIVESLTAAKSLNANDTHIKTSEYASRRIQLLTMSVTGVELNDCGSTDYYDLLVTEQMLDNMKGKYYLRSDTGQLDYIRGNEKHLIGTIVKVRTIFGCKVPDPSKVCTKCLGKVSENFKENSNLGYIMTAYLMEKLTQAILSTKHLTHSVKKSSIKLEGAVNKYFYSTDENEIYFNKDLNLKGLQLILPNARLGKLVDVLNLPHTNVSLTKVGELEVVQIRDLKHKTPFVETVNISYLDRNSIITKQLLEYIKRFKPESDNRGNFVISLDEFDKSQPVFSNPLKETNIISFVTRVASMIETTKDKVYDPYDKFLGVFNSVIDQFKCNMSVIEVIIYASTTLNAFNGDYRLGRGSQHPRCEGKMLLHRHRSVSTLLIYEEQMKELKDQAPIMFSNVNRMDSVLDVLYVPQAIVKD